MKINIYKTQLDILENKISRVRRLKFLIEESKNDEFFEIASGCARIEISGYELKEKLQELFEKEMQEYKKCLESFNKIELESELED